MTRLGVVLAGLIVVVGMVALARLTLPPPHEEVRYRPAGFADLDGWQTDGLLPAATAWQRSCRRIMRTGGDTPMGADGLFGHVRDWRPACRALTDLMADAPTTAQIRDFYETWMQPVAVTAGARRTGLFTGYFEPEYQGSLQRSEEFSVPLYTRPGNLVMVDLGDFRSKWEGERIAGRVEDGRLRPFPSRREIEEKGLGKQAEPLVWLENPIDAFFLHIQGSGLIRLRDGSVMRVGYAGQNGREYTPIGRVLVAKHDVPPERISMARIRSWLEENDSLADQLMRMNESYVFFREIRDAGPVGSEDVVLSPGRSLAVDRAVIPMGVPVWLETRAPRPDAQDSRSLHRLMVAQDTGSAIKGPVRGDVFWGPGDDAEAIAGRMKSRGRYYVLVPRSVIEDRGG